jgi:hypothetical protein
MVRPFTIALAAIAWFAASGCQQSSPPAEDPRIAALSSQVVTLQTAITKMEGDQKFLLTRVAKAEKQIRANAPKTEVEFDPSSTSYQRVDGDLGTFAVAISDVRQFADGVRVTLKLGNLSAVTYSGARLTLEYGARTPSDMGTDLDAAAKWLESLQERTEKITTNLAPGRWNPVQITLPRIDAKEFGYLSVSVETDEISLH